MFAEQAIGASAREGRLEQAMEFVCGDEEQTTLELNMCWSEQLVDITPLAKLGELQSLQQLTLGLSSCDSLVDVSPLAKLGELQSLQQLTLSLRDNYKLPSRLQKEFTSLAEFLAACESGALHLGLRRHAAEA